MTYPKSKLSSVVFKGFKKAWASSPNLRSPPSVILLYHVADLKKWLPTAHLRPHVVLRLLFGLVDRKYPLQSAEREIQQIKERLRERLETMYPETQAHLPEEQREGHIPKAVWKAIEKCIGNLPDLAMTGIPQKHATPANPPDNIDVILETIRPSLVTADKDGETIVSKDNRETLTLRQLARKPVPVLRARTNVELVDQWNWNFLQLAFPYSIPRVVGGADWPSQKRPRRQADAAQLLPWDYLGMHARRVESNLKNDWTLIPSQRNLTLKWDALCGDHVACKHSVSQEKVGAAHATELTAAMDGLYNKLVKGYWTDSNGVRRSINKDVGKLRYAEGLSKVEKNIIDDLEFLSKKFAGTKQVRLLMGHYLFGAAISYGTPLFWTISPNATQSGLTIRLSRYLKDDPFIETPESKGHKFRRWIGQRIPMEVLKIVAAFR